MNPIHDTVIIRCSSCGKKLAQIEYFPHVEAIQCLSCGSSTTAQVNVDYALTIICLPFDNQSWPNDKNIPNQRKVHRDYFRKKFTGSFSEGELRELCFDSGIDYENLPGARKSDKAIEIIRYFERRNQMEELVKIVRKKRPNILW